MRSALSIVALLAALGCSGSKESTDAGPDAGDAGDQELDAGPTTNSVMGNVTLNGPLPGGTVTVALTTQPWSSTPMIAASAMISTTTATTYPYAITDVPDNSYYLTTVVTDEAGTTANPQTNWPIALGPLSRQTTLDLPVTVGRVHGNIDVMGAADVPVEIIIGTPTEADGAAGVVFGAANVQLGAADGGYSETTYDVFGLPDGQYQAIALFQLSGDTSFQDAYTNGHYLPVRTLPAVDISGGSDVEIDFTGTL